MDPPAQTKTLNIVEEVFNLFNKGYDYEKKYEQELMNAWATFRVTVGNILVQGYRIFKRLPTLQCIIFSHRSNHETKYLYLKIVPYFTTPLTTLFFTQFSMAVEQINHLKQKNTHSYTLAICYLMEKMYLHIYNSAFVNNSLFKDKLSYNSKQDLVKALQQNQTMVVECKFEPEAKAERELSEDSQEQFRKLKDIMFHYIDTFGQKYKTNYYKDLEKKSLTSYNIENLINTMSMIVFEETKATKQVGQTTPMYSQIQSSVWTAFKIRKNELESDRKDLVLSGNGRALVIDIIFMKDVQKYAQAVSYQKQVMEMLQQYKKTHADTQVKVIMITNQINTKSGYGLTYTCHSADPNEKKPEKPTQQKPAQSSRQNPAKDNKQKPAESSRS